MSNYRNQAEVLQAVSEGKLTVEEASSYLRDLKPLQNRGFSVKITGEKKCVQIRGKGISGRFGCTLYAQGLLTILDHADVLREFIEHNRSALSWREDADK